MARWKATSGRPFLIDARSLAKQVEIQVQLADGVLRVMVPRERLFSSTTYIFIMWMVGSSVVLFVVAMMFMRNQVRPIRRLAQAADRFGKGQDVADFKPEGAAEVRQAATAFLRMRERIKRQITQRTEILAGVSHDLRTPLTRMKLELAMLGDHSARGNLETDVAEMEHMVEGYLAFARGEGAENPESTDVSGLLRRRGRPNAPRGPGGGFAHRGDDDRAAPATDHAPLPDQPDRQRPALWRPRRDQRRTTQEVH